MSLKYWGGRKRAKQEPARRVDLSPKRRCRTLERYRDERAILAPPITSRFAIRAKAMRAALRALGYHVEPMPGVDDPTDPPTTAGAP